MHTTYKTPKKATSGICTKTIRRNITDTDETSSSMEEENVPAIAKQSRKSTRTSKPIKHYQEYCADLSHDKCINRSTSVIVITSDDTDSDRNEENNIVKKPSENDIELLNTDYNVAGTSMFGFNTPKKSDGMALAAQTATPRTPKTPKTPRTSTKTPDTKCKKHNIEPKTPAYIRTRVKNQIAKIITSSDSEFSANDDSSFRPSDESDADTTSSSSNSANSLTNDDDDDNDAGDDEPKTPAKTRRAIVVPVLPKTPSAARLRQTARVKKTAEYVPESDGYFQTHTSSKILTSDHTLDRLKNPRLAADRLFSLLAEMKLSNEHELAINAIIEEYSSYFTKWLCILNEGFNILLYGLGSKRQLLQTFHREELLKETVLVINGFFPSLTLKDVLDSIIGEILDAGTSPANPHEAVDMIEEEFALIPETHLYLIVHNLDGVMLRNAKAQSIMSRLAKIENIHMLASIDHINTPLLWDHNKLSNYNFSWWDCTTMLPYCAETAFENSLLVQNSGELALSSLRSVFCSLTNNSRGIYMLIVKYQLKHKVNPNYQGMSFKDLYSSCREMFLVSSDLALRAQLTEFLDHKLVKMRRAVDGSEQLTIPIESTLLQQFLDEQEKK